MFGTTTTTSNSATTTLEPQSRAAGTATAGQTTITGPGGGAAAEHNFEVYDERGGQLSGAGAGAGGIERRRSAREPLVTRGTLKAVTGLATEPPLDVLVVDVSLHGVGLRSAESLEVGDLYHVEIGAGPLHLTSRARIVRCRLRRDGNFDIGAEFC